MVIRSGLYALSNKMKHMEYQERGTGTGHKFNFRPDVPAAGDKE